VKRQHKLTSSAELSNKDKTTRRRLLLRQRRIAKTEKGTSQWREKRN